MTPMICALLSDIHSNLAALQAVLKDLKARGHFDMIWCMGDIVGYGPEPNECVRLLREYDLLSVAGNHDRGATGLTSLADFNPEAAAACRWSGKHLHKNEADYIKTLPLITERGGFTLAHGSPRDPVWEYLVSTDAARMSMGFFHTPYCLVGHSHVPLVFEFVKATGECKMLTLKPETPLRLGENRLIVNPGAVGQPRDGDPRASYAIYDSEGCTVTFHRIKYDIKSTQRRIIDAGLPPGLADRLGHGR